MDAPSSELASLYDAEVRDSFEGHESLIDSEKAARMLDWRAERSCRET